MFEAFSLILGIPSAIQATQSLLSHWRDVEGLPREVEEELHQSGEVLASLLPQLRDFAASFDKLEAWKQVHDITNRARFNLLETHRKVAGSADWHEFANHVFCPEVRQRILRELKSMRGVDQTIPRIAVYKRSGKIRDALDDLRDTNDDKMSWFAVLETLIERTRKAAEESNAKVVYESLDDLFNYCDHLNTLADNALKDGIEQYHRVTEKLRDEIDQLD